MARIETVTTVCDLPHQPDQPDEPAATFEISSKGVGRFEVDLCELHTRNLLGPAIANGRKMKGRQRRG